jgi:hypothetical protein
MGNTINLQWRKSSYSGSGGSDCVTVGQAATAIVVRDSKQGDRSPVLAFTPDTWRELLAAIKPSQNTPLGTSTERATISIDRADRGPCHAQNIERRLLPGSREAIETSARIRHR